MPTRLTELEREMVLEQAIRLHASQHTPDVLCVARFADRPHQSCSRQGTKSVSSDQAGQAEANSPHEAIVAGLSS